MICFEEFDTETLYPVVLPCGHTYICAQCASRLDRCMECRESLFAPTEPSELKAIDAASSNLHPVHGRRGYDSNSMMRSAVRSGRRPPQNQSHKKAAPKPRKRLPLPKNMVLLSLIEASKLAKDANYNYSISKSLSDDDVIEESKILMSTDLATSSCGTYAVARAEGLKIVPSMDDIVSKSTRRLFGEENLIGKSVTKKKKAFGFQSHAHTPQEMHLSYGDR